VKLRPAASRDFEGEKMDLDEHKEALGKMMLSDKRPYSIYHNAGDCWGLIELMLSCLKKCHADLDKIAKIARWDTK